MTSRNMEVPYTLPKCKKPENVRHAPFVTYFTNALYNLRIREMPGKRVVIPRRSCMHNIHETKHSRRTNQRLTFHWVALEGRVERDGATGLMIREKAERGRKPFA